MDEVKALVIGLVGMFIGGVVRELWRRHRQRSVREDIEFLRWERQHLEQMKRSSVEMNRSAFRAVFSLASLAAAGQTVYFCSVFAGIPGVGVWLAMVMWAVVAATAFKFFRRYENLKDYKDSLEKLDGKITKLEQKANQAMQLPR